MSPSGPRPARRAADLRAATGQRVQQQRRRPLPGWLDSPGRRRTVALVPAVVFAIGVVSAAVTDGLGLLLVVLAGALSLAGSLVLPSATQMLATAPEELLDERETSRRDRAYRPAFQWALVLLGALWVLLVADGLVSRVTGAGVVEGDGWMRLALATFLAAAALPTAVLAWTWQPADDHDD